MINYHRFCLVSNGHDIICFLDHRIRNYYSNGFNTFQEKKKLTQYQIFDEKNKLSDEDIRMFNNENNEAFIFNNKYSKQVEFIHNLQINHIPDVENRDKVISLNNLSNTQIFLEIL